MARFKVTHSDDACCIEIVGDIRNPEPSTAVVKFPGGCIEVSRCSDGSYWAHLSCNTSEGNPEEPADALGAIVDSRIDYTPQAYARNGGRIDPIPACEDIQHVAVRIARASDGVAA